MGVQNTDETYLLPSGVVTAKSDLSFLEVGEQALDVGTGAEYVRIQDTGTPSNDIVRTTAGPGQLRDRYVVVNEASDFPAVNNGTRTLADNTYYEINGTVTIDNPLELGSNSFIAGLHWSDDVLSYTGTGGAIRGTDQNFFMRYLTVVAPNGLGFDVSATTSEEMLLSLCNFVNCDQGGRVNGFRVQTFIKCNFESFSSIGLELGGTTEKTFLDGCPIRGGADGSIGLKFNSTYSTGSVDLESLFFKNYGLNTEGINFDTNASFSNFAILSGTLFDTTVTDATVNFDQTTPGWDFNGNSGIPDSRTIANMQMTSNSTTTTISAQNTWTKIEGTTTLERGERFTMPQNNRLTYTGERGPVALSYNLHVALNATANNEVYEVGISVNGNDPLAQTIFSHFIVDKDTPEVSGYNGVLTINPTDYFELWIKNTTSSNDITVTRFSLTVTGS